MNNRVYKQGQGGKYISLISPLNAANVLYSAVLHNENRCWDKYKLLSTNNRNRSW